MRWFRGRRRRKKERKRGRRKRRKRRKRKKERKKECDRRGTSEDHRPMKSSHVILLSF